MNTRWAVVVTDDLFNDHTAEGTETATRWIFETCKGAAGVQALRLEAFPHGNEGWLLVDTWNGSFHDLVNRAIGEARARTEFTLSRAEEEDALRPLVASLKAMADPLGFIRASYQNGCYDAMAVAMFKSSTD